MKSIDFKKALKFLLVALAYTVLWIITNALLPYSQAFKDMAADASPLSIVFLFICSIFICFAICFIAANSNWRGMKRIAGISLAVFMICSFLTQLDTLFFGNAFPILTKIDILSIMFAALPPIVVATMLGVKFFGNNNACEKVEQIPVLKFVPRLTIIGLIYSFVYYLFGYFVLWQFEEARIFYSGVSENAGFFGQLMNNDPILYPFSFVRGVMFASFLLPLFYMLQEQGRKKFIISACLTYLTTAILLIIPNPLFPDVVRWAHFIEMTSSMLLFGIISGIILYVPSKSSKL